MSKSAADGYFWWDSRVNNVIVVIDLGAGLEPSMALHDVVFVPTESWSDKQEAHDWHSPSESLEIQVRNTAGVQREKVPCDVLAL